MIRYPLVAPMLVFCSALLAQEKVPPKVVSETLTKFATVAKVVVAKNGDYAKSLATFSPSPDGAKIEFGGKVFKYSPDADWRPSINRLSMVPVIYTTTLPMSELAFMFLNLVSRTESTSA